MKEQREAMNRKARDLVEYANSIGCKVEIGRGFEQTIVSYPPPPLGKEQGDDIFTIEIRRPRNMTHTP